MTKRKDTLPWGRNGQLTHGMSKTRIYSIWCSMRKRCENPKATYYDDYGGRGISVCERWLTFENFHADMGDPPDGLTLDRTDNDKGYSPENCRWATRLDQSRNRRGRCSIAAFGKEMILAEWAQETGLKENTIRGRMRAGWSIERALSKPKRGVVFSDMEKT